MREVIHILPILSNALEPGYGGAITSKAFGVPWRASRAAVPAISSQSTFNLTAVSDVLGFGVGIGCSESQELNDTVLSDQGDSG
jgi:hypothetical protein